MRILRVQGEDSEKMTTPFSNMYNTLESTLYCSESLLDDALDPTPPTLQHTIETKMAGLSYDTNNSCGFSLDGRSGIHCVTITRGIVSTRLDYAIKEYCPSELDYISRQVASHTLAEGALEPTDPRIVDLLSKWLVDIVLCTHN
jgi:hypothetical protein